MNIQILIFLSAAILVGAPRAHAQTAQMRLAGGHVVVAPGTHLIVREELHILQGARLTMQWESFLHGNSLQIHSGGTLDGSGVVSTQLVDNAGLILVDDGPGTGLTFNGTVRDFDGTILVKNDSAIALNGGYEATGGSVLDMIFSSSPVPAGLTSQGVVLTMDSLPRLSPPDIVGNNPVGMSFIAYAGHTYQLEKNSNLSNPDGWVSVGDPITPDTTTNLIFDDLGTDILTSPRIFYRVSIKD